MHFKLKEKRNVKKSLISTGIIILNSKGKIIQISNTAKKIFNIKNKKILGKSISEAFPEIETYNNLDLEDCEKTTKIKYKDKELIVEKLPISNEEKAEGTIMILYDDSEYKSILKELNREKNIKEILNTVLEIIYDGIVVVNTDGIITMISKAYSEFLEVDRKKVIGKPVTEVIENTRMHIVAKTGISEIAQLQKLKGKYMIATRVPIIKEGKVQGAVGKVLFRNVKDFNSLYNKIKRLEKDIERYSGDIKESNYAIYSFNNIIGSSAKMKEAIEIAKKASHTNSSVLLRGESGTGKEIFAHAIHNASNRAHGNFVKVNCAAIPTELLESELFGYEKGSFTGANKEGKIGKFELANGGTIFLDEIGDMPLHMQAKLLRVLQEKEVERIGSTVTRSIDIRVIAATNKDLEKMLRLGEFREDLYYRLNVVSIKIPPLRERPEDIVTLTNYLIDKICNKLDKKVAGIDKSALDAMKKYSWDGNVRELENIIERAINLVEYGGTIKSEHLPSEIAVGIANKHVYSLDEVLNKAEKEAIINALNVYSGNKSKVAKALKISRTTLYEKMNKHSIYIE